ncbi:unnamed protein product [Absidia cylindrospora]
MLLSPFELLYGTTCNPMDKDIVDKIGVAYGFGRLMKILDLRDISYFRSFVQEQELVGNKYAIGDEVIRLKQPVKLKGKMEAFYEDEVYTVVAAYENNVYQLISTKGVILKRRVHGSQLRKYTART